MIELRKRETFLANNLEYDFGIEITHWQHNTENRWNVYAVIREENPLYEIMSTGTKKSYKTLDELEKYLHWGITYKVNGYHKHPDQPKRSGWFLKIGSDYNHLGDDKFSSYSTIEEAQEVQFDANRLYNYLIERTKQEKEETR